jgi:hypothetical protein
MSNRQQRRQFDRQLRKLIRTKGDNCSLCGIGFQHNSRTFGGYDQHGEIALVGECCAARLHEVHTAGVFSQRHYDFLPSESANESGYGVEQIADAISALQRTIAATDEELKDGWQRGGMSLPHGPIHVLEYPWTLDDRDWFEQHPERSHRARSLFVGEFRPEEIGPVPEGHQPLMLIRQVEPGRRIRAGFFIPSQMLPVPDAESVAHALFEIATGHEPIPRGGEAMGALIKKYTISDQGGQAS